MKKVKIKNINIKLDFKLIKAIIKLISLKYFDN